MLNPQVKLNPDTLDRTKLESKATRDGFGKGLVDAGKANGNVVALCADLSESTRMEWFQKEFPERFVEVGVAEQNLATVASGMAAIGKIPFIASYATFSPGRNWEQIRTTIALNNQPVIIAGCHAGVSVGPDGATHQALEDVALMRSLPNMTVIVPCDMNEAYKATLAIAQSGSPAYIRLGRAGTPSFTTIDTPFHIGKAQIVWDSEKPTVGIITCGTLVYEAIKAAEELSKQGIESVVMNLATIKPLDREAVVELAKRTGAIVTCEEHQIAGGMGSAVAECLASEFPVPMEFIGVHDRFGQSGTPEELFREYGLTADDIAKAVLRVTSRRTQL
jgi:transketolase